MDGDSTDGRFDRTLRALIACGVLASLAIAWRAWSSSRVFPVAPAFGLTAVPFPVPEILFAALVVSILCAGLLRRPRVAIIAAFVAAALSALTDQTRLQPWLYQELLLFGCFGFLPKEERRSGLVVILALAYAWSGIQKLQPMFAGSVFPWMLAGITHDSALHVPPAAGLIAALVELCAGLGLLFRSSRGIAAIVLVLMHLTILLAIGPLGHDWNAVVWPWNILLPLLVLCLLPRRAELSAWRWMILPKRPYRIALLALVGVLPALSFVGLWDSYLSFSLYSGNVDDMTIGAQAVAALPASIRDAASSDGNGTIVSASMWAVRELAVPAYPEPRVFREIARRLCADSPSPRELVFILYPKTLWTGGGDREGFGCE
jgi:hypothetical protein